MDRLLMMDKDQFIAEMQAEVRRVLGEVADAVNNAPTGNVISGSEMAVREAMARLRERAFERAVQMRIGSTESSFFPSEGCDGQGEAEQGACAADDAERQRADHLGSPPLLRPGRGQRQSG